MKKLLAFSIGLLAISYVNAFESSELIIKSGVGFDSEFEYRGRKQGQKIFTPQTEIGLPLFERGEFYVGMQSFLSTDGAGPPALDVKDATSTDYIPANGRVGTDLSLTAIPAKKSDKKTQPKFINGSYPMIRTMNQVDVYSGFNYQMTDILSADLGYVHHFYTNLKGKVAGVLGKVDVPEIGTVMAGNNALVDGGRYVSYRFEPIFFKKSNSNEVYAGVMADVLLNPAVYLAYDFNRRELNFEGRINYTIDLEKYGFSGFSVDLNAKLGYDRAGKPFGIPWSDWTSSNESTTNRYVKYDRAANALVNDKEAKDLELNSNIVNAGLHGGKKGYVYWGAGSDLIYALNDNARVRAGVRYIGNDASKESWVNCINRGSDGKGHKNLLLFSTSIDFSF
ncbi:MAG: hypothetical protein LBI37_03595 [Puniceicoccales bacterium]|jgi:hypothetical protein|nr:hypothetical protein [Puniceicoccales bacterium]